MLQLFVLHLQVLQLFVLHLQVLPAAAGAASAAAVSVADASVPSYKTLPLLYEMAWHCELTPIDINGAHVGQMMI